MTLEENLARIKAILAKLPEELSGIAKNATMRAVEKAAELTPPTQDDLKGTNTRSGELKQHWETDSKTEPEKKGNTFVTYLNNDKDYSSYVNDGHRMDRHFVPGLYVKPASGMLEYDPSADVGIIVGTKTFYVPGLHMVDEAKKEYDRVVKEESKRLEELLK